MISSSSLIKKTSKIFFPEDCISYESGFIIGWNIRSFVACVATVVSGISVNFYFNYFQHLNKQTFFFQLGDLQTIIKQFEFDGNLRTGTGAPLSILGEWISHHDSKQEKAIWEESVKDGIFQK